MTDNPWQSLQSAYPWPPKRPSVTGPHVHRVHGWLSKGTEAIIREHLPESGVVLELGTWMGKSAKFMLDIAPEIQLVCIDHWLGSPEINRMHRDMLPEIFNLCRYHLWPYRERVLLLRMRMRDGMRKVHRAGLRPGMVYVDGAHDAQSVEDDARGAGILFPAATLIGDDWGRESVRQGLAAAAIQLQQQTTHNKNAWAMELR